MDSSNYENTPLVESILHPTDFSAASVNAFAHALTAAMNTRTELTLLHAGKGNAVGREWAKIPGVREMLEKWGYLEANSPRRAVFEKLAMRVSKVYVRSGNVVGSISEFLDRNPVDLIVLATSGRDGLAGWVRPSVAQRVARKTHTMTLFVPAQGQGFVSPDDGQIRIKRILIPFDESPDPLPAITYAARMAVFSSEERIEIRMIHAGDMGAVSRPGVIERPYLKWDWRYRPGDPAGEVLAEAAAFGADLIVTTTQKRDGILDTLRGSVADKIVRGAPCPVLAVPLEK